MSRRSQAFTSTVDTVHGPEGVGGDGPLFLGHSGRTSNMLQYMGRYDGTASRGGISVIVGGHLDDKAVENGWMR